MENWKQFILMAVFFLLGGLFYVNAQDMIVLKDGNMIAAKVVEISPTEIRYKRFDNLDGPTIVIPAVNVLSIRYENGDYEIINAGAIPQQKNIQAERPKDTAIDTNRFIFGINANAGGAIGYAYSGGSGGGINIELGKGNFNSEINLMFPIGGFGFLATFNYFWHSHIGGIYLGGGISYIFLKDYLTVYRGGKTGNLNFVDDGNYKDSIAWNSQFNTFGINLGYKFVLSSGMYFRTGAYASMAVDWAVLGWADLGYSSNRPGYSFYIKPDLAIGWTMR